MKQSISLGWESHRLSLILLFSKKIYYFILFAGISTDFYNIDGALLDKLLSTIKSAEKDVRLIRPPAWYFSLIAQNTRGPPWAWLDLPSM